MISKDKICSTTSVAVGTTFSDAVEFKCFVKDGEKHTTEYYHCRLEQALINNRNNKN